MQSSSDVRIWWVKFTVVSPDPRHALSLVLWSCNKHPGAQAEPPDFDWTRWARPKPRLQNGSMTMFVVFCGPGLLFLLALELQIKACELPEAQAIQHTTVLCAVW